MKILQIVKTGDGANWAFDQARALKENGVEIITIIPNKEGKIAKKYIANNMDIIEGDFSLPVSRPWRYFKRKKELIKIVKKIKPDIIHLHFVTNVIFARIALRKSKIPRLFQVPGPLHLENRITRRAELMVASNNDYWAPSCKASQKIYNKYVDKNRVFLTYYGGYGGEECKKYKKTNKLRKDYCISDDTVVVGMISYFYKPKYYLGQTRGIKGHEDFIDAIKIINNNGVYRNIQAIVVGGAWGKSQKYEEKVKQYAKRNGVKNIIFTGFRDDIKDIYNDFDIVVHPSHSENLGGAAESLAAGVPTIATSVGGFPDIVIDNETGFLCKAKNPGSISDAIVEMLKNDRKTKQMAKNGQELVKSMLCIDKTARRVLSVYNMIIEGEY